MMAFYHRKIGSLLVYEEGSIGIVEDYFFDADNHETYIVTNTKTGVRKTVRWMDINHLTQVRMDKTND